MRYPIDPQVEVLSKTNSPDRTIKLEITEADELKLLVTIPECSFDIYLGLFIDVSSPVCKSKF
jgi:hypothetical protein